MTNARYGPTRSPTKDTAKPSSGARVGSTVSLNCDCSTSRVTNPVLPPVESNLAEAVLSVELRGEGGSVFLAYLSLYPDHGFIGSNLIGDFGTRSVGYRREPRPSVCEAGNCVRDIVLRSSPHLRHIGQAVIYGEGDCRSPQPPAAPKPQKAVLPALIGPRDVGRCGMR